MWSVFVKCHFLTVNYFSAYAHFRKKRNLFDPPCTLVQILQAEQALLHQQQWGNLVYTEEDQALCFETSNFCLEIYIMHISV